MKKKLVLVVAVLVAFLAVSFVVFANSDDDYKVIKRAASVEKSSGTPTFFCLEVKDNKAKKVEVKMKVPLSLVEMLSDSVKDKIDEKVGSDGKNCKIGINDIDIKKVLAELKKGGSEILIEVDNGDNSVKIWLE